MTASPPDGTGPGDAPVLVMLAAGLAKRFGGGCKPLAPVGLRGEAIIDLTASDALAAGFGHIVVVLGPVTGPAITYHVERCWPDTVEVSFAEQTTPLGTAHAAMCARRHVGHRPFALVNADDVYGAAALSVLNRHLRHSDEHANVSFRLEDTVVSDAPVTRGTCSVGPDGLLREMVERKRVSRTPEGSFGADDGRRPPTLAPDTPVSVNLWGFRPSIWPVLEAAVRAVHPGVGSDGEVDAATVGNEEVLLPEVVDAMISGRLPGGVDAAADTVRVLHADGRCIGVTHPGDLVAARMELAVMIGHGARDDRLWVLGN